MTDQPDTADEMQPVAPESVVPESVVEGSAMPDEPNLVQPDLAAESLEPLPARTAAEILGAVEAVLFVADNPLDAAAIASGLDCPTETVLEALTELAASYDARNAGIALQEIAGGFRLYTRENWAEDVERFLLNGQRTRLSQAGLETLAVIAYRAPITRSRIAAIRGVNVDGVVRTLLSRGLIAEVGADPDTSGAMYGTTPLFLERMGLRSLDDLPSLAPLLPELDELDVDAL